MKRIYEYMMIWFWVVAFSVLFVITFCYIYFWNAEHFLVYFNLYHEKEIELIMFVTALICGLIVQIKTKSFSRF